jgi:hypothetical protein
MVGRQVGACSRTGAPGSAVAAVAGIVTAVTSLLGGCGESGRQVGDMLEGTWESPGGALTVFADGTWETSAPDVDEPPFDGGPYEVQGTTLTMTTALTENIVRTDFTCNEGDVGVYELTFSDDGSVLTMELVRDDCEGRSSEGGEQVRVAD